MELIHLLLSSRIDAYKFSFLPRTIRDWNALPPSQSQACATYYAALLPRRGPHIASHSVCLSVRPVIVTERHVAPPSELQWHTCTFRHALRAAYRTAILATQILVLSRKPSTNSQTIIFIIAEPCGFQKSKHCHQWLSDSSKRKAEYWEEVKEGARGS